MNVTPTSAIEFAAIVVALSLGYLWWEKRRAIGERIDPVRSLPIADAAAAVLVEQLMPEIAAYLEDA